MARVLTGARNHWKKLTFASAVVAFGGNYLWTEHEINSHMRQVCRSLPETPSSRPYYAVVVLNPVANKKKCEKIFRKYCEPMLHLAGYKVDIVKTKEVGHAKSLIESLPYLPDVLVVAGGDGTSSEVVTGLLRRKEDPCPILMLPLGEKNDTVASYRPVNSNNKVEYVKCLSSCVLSMLQEHLRYRNVLKYEVLDAGDSSEEAPKPIYGLQRFSWGLLRDIESIKDKYWYFGSLRHHVAAAATALSKDMAKKVAASVTYTPPCPGCSKCVTAKPATQRVFKLFATKPTPMPYGATVTNELCGKQEKQDIQAQQVDIVPHENKQAFSELNTEIIGAISNGIDLVKNIKMKMKPTLSLKSRTMELIPHESDMPTYSIDGEEYDARPVKITIVPNTVKIYG